MRRERHGRIEGRRGQALRDAKLQREQFGHRGKPRIGPDGWPMDDAR